MRSVDHPELRPRDRANIETDLMGGQATAKGALRNVLRQLRGQRLRSEDRTQFPRPVEMTRLAQCPLADREGSTL
jgi:hypothetical protein